MSDKQGAPNGLRYGAVLGRLQPLHLGHIEYFDAAKAKCDRLIVGITNPELQNLIKDNADPRRSDSENNPFSFFDRLEMVTAALLEMGWTPEEFAVVPAPVNTPSLVPNYLPPPEATTIFVTIYDAWGDRKSELVSSLGYEVEVLWRRRMSDRLTSGTELREAMRNGYPWRHLVPPAVSTYIDDNGLLNSLEPDRKECTP